MPGKRSKRLCALPKETIARYKGRVVRVLGEARGERSMIEWVDECNKIRRTAVKWTNLSPLPAQLF
jgi:hypothetical protein